MFAEAKTITGAPFLWEKLTASQACSLVDSWGAGVRRIHNGLISHTATPPKVMIPR